MDTSPERKRGRPREDKPSIVVSCRISADYEEDFIKMQEDLGRAASWISGRATERAIDSWRQSFNEEHFTSLQVREAFVKDRMLTDAAAAKLQATSPASTEPEEKEKEKESEP